MHGKNPTKGTNKTCLLEEVGFGVRAEQAGHTWRCPRGRSGWGRVGRGKHRAGGGERGVLSWLQQGKGLPAGSPLAFPPPPGSQGSAGCTGRVTHIQIPRHRRLQMFGPRWVVQGERFVSEPGVENRPLALTLTPGAGSCSHSPSRSCRRHRGSLLPAPRPEQKFGASG